MWLPKTGAPKTDDVDLPSILLQPKWYFVPSGVVIRHRSLCQLSVMSLLASLR